MAKFLNETEAAGLAAHVGAAPGDCIFFGAGAVKASRALLGAARLEIGHRCGLVEPGSWGFLWVHDAPLFEPASEAVAAGDVAVGSGAWTAVHHAFTSPKKEFLDTFDTEPGTALAYAYDMVCNGNEIGGGSIRIHRRDVQERVFAVMGLSEADAQEKFGFLLDAFQYGAPPHGGIAFGWDRICALLSGSDSIREVIAFPKSGGGYDPLTGAPAPITAQQRKEAGVDARPANGPAHPVNNSARGTYGWSMSDMSVKNSPTCGVVGRPGTGWVGWCRAGGLGRAGRAGRAGTGWERLGETGADVWGNASRPNGSLLAS